MKNVSFKMFSGLVLAGLLLAGCASPEQTAEAQSLDTVPLLPDQTEKMQLKEAMVQLDKKENRRAARNFLELKEHATNPDIRAEAVLGAAVALQRSGNTSGALGVLMPAPAAATNLTEARHLALLGELYLRSNAFSTAKIWLEEALKCPNLPVTAWTAAARFNLGKALISLDETEDAIIAFTAAQKDFVKLGNATAAEICASAARRLKSIEKLAVEKK